MCCYLVIHLMFYLSSAFEQFQLQRYATIIDGFILTDTIFICIFIIFFFQIIYYLLASRVRFNEIKFISFFFKKIYVFIYNIVLSYLNEEGVKFFPFLFYLFIFLSISNLVGIMPYSFTITSHLTVTFGLAFMIWLGMLIGVGFEKHGLSLLNMFFIDDVPFRIIPLLIIIEFISFLFRSVSLALRLFANIVAGHILLDTIALVTYKMVFPQVITLKSFLFSLFAFVICLVLLVFETIVALLQSYIFVVLTCIYLKDMIELHGSDDEHSDE